MKIETKIIWFNVQEKVSKNILHILTGKSHRVPTKIRNLLLKLTLVHLNLYQAN